VKRIRALRADPDSPFGRAILSLGAGSPAFQGSGLIYLQACHGEANVRIPPRRRCGGMDTLFHYSPARSEVPVFA
jgi:hypothetical protein